MGCGGNMTKSVSQAGGVLQIQISGESEATEIGVQLRNEIPGYCLAMIGAAVSGTPPSSPPSTPVPPTPPSPSPPAPPSPPPPTPPVPPSNFSPLEDLNFRGDPSDPESAYGYNYYSPSGQYTIPLGQTVYFKIDPDTVGGYIYADVWVFNYDQTPPTMRCGTGDICASLLTIDRATGAIIATYQFPRRQGNHGISVSSDHYLILQVTELGYRDMPMSLWWYGYT
jgi:hypothetical protein